MQAQGNGIGEIRLPDDDDRTATHCVADHDRAGGRALVERPKDSRAAMSERIASWAKRRICLNPDYAFPTRGGVGNHIWRQTLR
jgi:hypothetical protein